MSESTQLQTTNGGAVAAPAIDTLQQSVYESLALKGDISGLTAEDKVRYMQRLCESLGLNPFTQPFLPLKLSGKEVLYATRGCTDQLASVHKLTREIIKTETINDVYIATAKVTGPDGRFDISTGAVSLAGLKGDNMANALMKTETKAKRRATLCYCGLGFLDESEIETIPPDRIDRVPTSPAKTSFPPTKAQLVEAAKTEDPQTRTAELQQIAGKNVSGDQFTGLPNALKGDEPQWRVGIEKMMRLVDQSPASISNVLKKFDEDPTKCEAAWIAVMKTVLKKLIESELWAYTEEGTLQLLERFGVTEIDNASRGQLEALFNDLTNNGVLNRYATA